MSGKKCRSAVAWLVSIALLLMLGGVSAVAQEQQKEPPKKAEPRGKRGEAKAPEKQAPSQQANKPKQEAPAPQTNRPRQESPAPQTNRPKQEPAPPAASRPVQQTPPVLQRGQRPDQRPPEPGQRTVQPQIGRPVQQPQPTPPPTAGQRAEPQRPQRGERPPANDVMQRPQQGGRPAPNEAAPRGPQGDSRRGQTGFFQNAGRVITTRGGDSVHRDPAGRVTEVRVKNGGVVYHAPNGVRRVEVVHPGDRVIVAEAPGHGYVQRPLVFHDRRFVKRTYFYGGRSYARVYRPVTYRGAMFEIYTPVRYYRPAYYSYVFNPWPAPVFWSWGWDSRPWYGFYGGYFVPYRAYRSPAFWLTDFFIAATLQAAYDERVAAGVTPVPVPDSEVVMSPEVKDLIADEVRRQIEHERAESQYPAGYAPDDVPVWADNTSHVFVAYRAIGVPSSNGYCTVGEGDVLQLNGMPPPYSPTADLLVLASRRHDCRKGSVVSVQLQDLQDMNNRMRETVESGLEDLQARQGQRGIPPLPPSAVGAIDTPLAAEATPEMSAGAELNQAYRDTDQAEQYALAQAGDDPAANTPTVSLGQTIDQVRSVLGPPQQIMNVGSKQIYVYSNLKVTFLNGRVSDVQ